MKKTTLLFLLWTACISFLSLAVQAQVQLYRQLPVFALSSIYKVEIAQGANPYQEIFVYQMGTDGTGVATQTENWGNFAFEPASGAVRIRVSMKDGSALSASNAQLVNKTYTDVNTSFSGNSMIITTASAKKHLLIKVAGQTGKPLVVFADPLQESAIAPGANVVRFAARSTPYVQTAANDRYTIPNDVDVVYLEDGAMIKGTIHTGSGRSKPVKVMGRGVVLGNGPIINGLSGIPYNAVVLVHGNGNVVEGITVIKSRHFGIDVGTDGVVDNAKMFGYNANNDGIVGGRRSQILHTFSKVNDDHVKLYNDDMVVRNCTFYAQTNGAIFQLSWGGSGPAHNCTVENSEVVAVEFTYCGDPALNQGGTARAFINIHDHNEGNSNFSGHTFRNIRIQGQLLRFISLNGKYGSNNFSFTNALLENITVDNVPTSQSLLYTGGTHSFGMTFTNVTFAGQCLARSSFKTEGTANLTISCPGGGGTDTTAPTVPAAVTASGITATSAVLSWTASTDNVGVTGYEVYQNNTLVTTVTGTSATLTGLTCNTAYAFKVRAKDAAGNMSAFSANASVTTAACTPPPTCTTVRTEAENFTAQSGTQIEAATRLAFINNGDWADYSVNVPCTGSYTFRVRVATQTAGGTLTLRKGTTNLGSVAVTNTGGWMTWVNKTVTVNLTAGVQTLRLVFSGTGTGYLYNVDWFEVQPVTAARTAPVAGSVVTLFPNPAREELHIEGMISNEKVAIFNLQGQLLKVSGQSVIRIAELPKGMYLLRHAGQSYRFVKE